jgi:hypothetical protein
MASQIKVEIVGKDQFWSDAILVEWAHRYPSRQLVALSDGTIRLDTSWLDSLMEVADECNCKIVASPQDPSRRSLFRQLIPSKS